MLSNYNSSDNLANYLGYDSKEIKTAPTTVQKDDVSLWQQYDNFTWDIISNGEDAIDSFELANEKAKDNIVQTYDNVSQSLDNAVTQVKSTLNTSRNVVIIGGALVVSLFLWNIIGRDIYQIAKGK